MTQNSNAALKRLDLANNECFKHTLEALVSLKGVTHLNLANLKGFTAAFSTLLSLPSLKVLDLRGVREVFAKGYGAGEVDEKLAQILAKNTSLMCVKLDPEIAQDARAHHIKSLFAPGRPGFSILLGVAGAFLAEILKQDVAGDAQLSFARELDARSAMRLMSTNSAMAGALSDALSGFEGAIHELSGDLSFDWDLACSGHDGQSEAADDDNSSNTTTNTTTTTTTNTTQPTHDREPLSLDPFGAVAQQHASLQANQAAHHPFVVQVQQPPVQVPAVSVQVPLDVVLAAVTDGDVAFVKSAVEELEFNVNQTDEQGNVLLLAATRNLDLQMVSTLLGLGASDDTGAVLAFAQVTGQRDRLRPGRRGHRRSPPKGSPRREGLREPAGCTIAPKMRCELTQWSENLPEISCALQPDPDTTDTAETFTTEEQRTQRSAENLADCSAILPSVPLRGSFHFTPSHSNLTPVQNMPAYASR